MGPRYEDHPEHLRIIREAALRAADPYEAVQAACAARALRDPALRHVGWVAIGKAAVRMREGMLAAGDGSEGVEGIAVAPEGAADAPGALIGDHPLPTARSVAAGKAVREFVSRCSGAGQGRVGPAAGIVTLLLSGGASSLVCLPAEGVTLADLRAVTSALLRSGAMIGELNTVRRHVEQLKGGRLAALASPCCMDVLALSDVIGDAPEVIASGPAWPDPTTFEDALAVLTRHRALEAGPTVTAHLRAGARGEASESLKMWDPRLMWVRTWIVASNAAALDAARAAAAALGFAIGPRPLGMVAGQAAAAGAGLAKAAMVPFRRQSPRAVIVGGETTVDVGTATGRGGRNQELALAAAVGFQGAPNLAAMALATDGVDGPTDAAGAVVNSQTYERARALGLDPDDALRRHDSYTLLDRLGCLIRTGPTGTNVNDIVVALAY